MSIYLSPKIVLPDLIYFCVHNRHTFYICDEIPYEHCKAYMVLK